MITGNWHFLFKFKSNSRNNRRDKCSCVGISAQDHCHSCHSGGAAHGHSSSCLIFINISRLSGRPRVCIKCPGCQQLSSRKSESWYNLIQFTNPRQPDVAIFTILNTTIMGDTDECQHQPASFIEWDLKGCLESESELYPGNECWHQRSRPAQFSHSIFS